MVGVDVKEVRLQIDYDGRVVEYVLLSCTECRLNTRGVP